MSAGHRENGSVSPYDLNYHYTVGFANKQTSAHSRLNFNQLQMFLRAVVFSAFIVMYLQNSSTLNSFS